MRVRRAAVRSAGFTMVEVMATIVVFSIIAWISVEALALTSRATLSTVHLSDLDQRANRTLSRVVRELRQAEMASLQPDPEKPYFTSTLSFRCTEINGANQIVSGSLRRLEFVPSDTDPRDGLDNDHDGLTDEHELRLVRDVGLPTEYATVLVRNVAALLDGELPNSKDDNGNELEDEPGFCIIRRGGVLEIRLSLEALDPTGELTTRTAETTLWPRN